MLPGSYQVPESHTCGPSMYQQADVESLGHKLESEVCPERYWASSQATDLSTCPSHHLLPSEHFPFKNEASAQFQDFMPPNATIFTGNTNPHVLQPLHLGDDQAAALAPFNSIPEAQAKQEMLAYQALCQAELFRSEKTPHRTQFQRENHILAERQRREEMNDKFTALKALLPKSTKKDKASIVGETINYVLELEKKLKKLQAASNGNNLHRQKRRALQIESSQETKLPTSSAQQGEDLSSKTAQVEIQLLGAQAVIKVICMRTRGLVLRILATLEGCKAEVVQSNVATLGNHAVLFFTIELSPGVTTSTEDLIAALELAACSSN